MNNRDFFNASSIKILLSSSFLILIVILIISSCDNGKNQTQQENESMTSGTFTVYCDEAMSGLLKRPFKMYDSMFPKVQLNIVPASARNAMAKLLSANARAIVIARDYLHDEDSLMKAFKVEKHIRLKMADDGLVFFTNQDFPLDTLNADILYKIFTNKDINLNKYFPNLKSEPEFVINNINSSEYANLKQLVAKNKTIQKKLTFVDNSDAVLEYIKNHKNAIGITYFYKISSNGYVKALKIGFQDSTGKYVSPKTVHQSYIVQNLYPYTVTYWTYLLKNSKDLPWWFGSYLEKEAIVQKYFLNAGIVPGYGRIHIVQEDQ